MHAIKKQKVGQSSKTTRVTRNFLPFCISPFKQCQCMQRDSSIRTADGSNQNLILIADDAFESLSEVEKDQVYNDLYGTANVMQETEDFVTDKLEELDAALEDISLENKSTYLLALDEENKQGTAYIQSVKFRLMFLRAERFDPLKAAVRLCRFFTVKKELFGVEKLPRRISQTDLSDDDKEALFCGGLTVCNEMDHCNRMAFVFRRQQYVFKHILNLKRAWFYYSLSCMENDERAQKLGVIIIFYGVGHVDNCQYIKAITKQFKTLGKLFHSLPFRVSIFHHCYNNKLAFIMSLILRSQETLNAARYYSYFGSHQHCRREMLKYGIHLDLLPVDQRGNYDMNILTTSLEKLHQKEENGITSLREEPFAPIHLEGNGNDDDDSSLGSY